MLTKLAPSQRDVHRFGLHKYPICRFFLNKSSFSPSQMNLWQKSSHDVAQNNFLSNFAPQMVGMWSAQHTPKVEQTTFLPNHHYEPGA